jgi:hypothetical protein
VEPTRLHKERKTKEQLAENYIITEAGKRSWMALRPIARDRRK